MNQLDSIIAAISLTMGAAWASGINLYAAVLVLGWLGSSGAIDLPPTLDILQDPVVLTAAGLMFCVEFLADKIPGIDSGWDAIQTFVRIPAGALLAAGAVGQVHPALSVSAALVGGAVATATHATKSGSRVLINTSPEPFSNWTASFSEDLMVIGGLWTAVHHPWIFLGLFIVFICLVSWMLPRIWGSILKVTNRILRLFSNNTDPTASSSSS